MSERAARVRAMVIAAVSGPAVKLWCMTAVFVALIVAGIWICQGWVFSVDGFVARADCGTGWTPALLLQQESGHTIIFLVYQLIAGTILAGLRMVPARFRFSAVLWAGFISSCGWTHATARIMFRIPAYHLDVTVLDVCVVLSLAALFNLISNVLAFVVRRSSADG